jgi:hypothetical protein
MQNGNNSTPKKNHWMEQSWWPLYNLVTTTRGMSVTLASLKQD